MMNWSLSSPRSATAGLRVMAVATCAVACIAALCLSVAPARAAIGVTGVQASLTDASGAPVVQAGAHPYAFTTGFSLQTHVTGTGDTLPVENLKDVEVDLPPGLVGDPSAAPQCAVKDFAGGYNANCPPATAIGVIQVDVGARPWSPSGATFSYPVYNLQPEPDEPAVFGFVMAGVPVRIVPHVRPTDYGLTATIHNISETLPVVGTRLTLWGVPADPSHDAYRGRCQAEDGSSWGMCQTNAEARPFMTLPTSCSDKLQFTARVDSWQDPGAYSSMTGAVKDAGGTPLGVQGCGRLSFSPSLSVSADTMAAGAPAGYSVDLTVPQSSSPLALASAEVKNVVVAMPHGTVVSASGADGLQACSEGQIGLHDATTPTCPDASKIGTVAIDTPLLTRPLEGSVYLAAQGNNPFGSMLALYLVAQGSGVTVKLAGKIEPDPGTGDLVATFDDTPQLPFNRMHLQFLGGARAPLANPTACGATTAKGTFTSWGGAPAASESTIVISGDGRGGPCVTGFQPQLRAGVADPVAGAHSAFSFQLVRGDGDQQLSTVKATLPLGLLASVKDVPLCPSAAADAGTCGGESLIGHLTVGVGPGEHPFYVQGGRAYLTDGYRGAPYGLSLVMPAIAGPLDLGTVVVRAAVNVDPRTTQLSVLTDALPTMLSGIPLDIRDVRLTMDRPGFMVNPTSCATQQVLATATSEAGSTATAASRFALGECQALPFAPRLTMALTGSSQTKKGRHPGVTALVTQQSGEANLRQVSVKLPAGIGVELANIGRACKAAAAAAGACPDSAIVGHASAVTRILPHPLEGKVYLVEGRRVDPKTGKAVPTLPQLWTALRGDIPIDLWADTAIVKGRLVTTFGNIPDAPISAFRLQIDGGSKGILATAKDLCRATVTAQRAIEGQNGKHTAGAMAVATPCGRSRSRKARVRP